MNLEKQLEVRRKWELFEKEMMTLGQLCGDCHLELQPALYDELRADLTAAFGPSTEEICYRGARAMVWVKRREMSEIHSQS